MIHKSLFTFIADIAFYISFEISSVLEKDENVQFVASKLVEFLVLLI